MGILSEIQSIPKLIRRFNELSKLHPRWDTYFAPAPTQKALVISFLQMFMSLRKGNLLSELSVIPTLDGGIALVWRNGMDDEYELCIDFQGKTSEWQ